MLLLWGSISALIICISIKLVNASHFKTHGTSLPGPKGKPVFGNLFDIPPYHSWLRFKEWADKYGPLFKLNIAGRTHVIISTEKTANDLLRERGNLYSSREYLPMASGNLSKDLRPLLLPYNDRWRRGRKLMHQLTMASAADSYQPIQDYESKKLLVAMLDDPSRYEKWLEMYASGVVFRIGFGRWIETGEEPELHRILAVCHNLERVASPGAYLVDSLPFLNYLPESIAPFKKEGRLLHEEETDLFRQLQNRVRDDIRRGEKTQSFTRTFIESQAQYQLSDDEGAYVIGTLFEAGSATTAAAMMSLILAICHHPEWLERMQNELDDVVGNRMPDFKDIHALPTVRAVIKETLRWRPVTAGGFPHQLIRDDEYNGYHFAKGTIFHPNQWAIHRDPSLYPDGDSFRPERWLDPHFPTYKAPLSRFPNLQNFSCFGFGRRICPGQNIAERSLNILTARIAWAFNISKNKNTDGSYSRLPIYNYTKGFNTQPEHFDFDLAARSARHASALKEAHTKSLSMKMNL